MTDLPPRCAGCRCGDEPPPPGPRSAAVLAHGQPGDPAPLQADLDAFAAQVAAHLPGWDVRGATLACPRSLTRLRGIGRIYPLFMADGWFVRSEMPRRLSAAGVEGYAVLPPLGLDPDLPALGLTLALDTAAAAGIAPAHATLVVVGHGSQRARASAASTRAFADVLAAADRFAAVTTAFIEEPPFLSELRPPAPALCLPFFATEAGHTTEDIPAGWREAGAPGPLTAPLGRVPAVAALVARAILRG
ncbi:CbiX/SirB N-terminal domain-containing protein [Paracoccus endophyticus]|uniref:CbiX/SirB N-terminal domain-containing protein n=1 Tax=Paracoccus endophyticus TaxID=2233774 RepID=UPI000DDB0357|nr:CbiX/SirB N-terminal domain-containing protein [Paracoccus endophyticus]